jgi:hypothetical protein
MALTRKQLTIIGSVVTVLVIGLVVGVTVGVVVGRRKPTPLTTQSIQPTQPIQPGAHEILANNPLIDG